ncbi:MAG: hypothetical protein ABIO02_00770 [Patescibacteria group bacterium]
MANPEGSYTFKHPKHIELDYRGVASDLMEVNNPVADRFMSVGDMRYNIVVTSLRSDRVIEYDQLGNTRIGKWIEVPRLRKKNPLLNVGKKDDVWNIAINDQILADEVLRDERKGAKFDEEYVNRFQEKVVEGIQNVLLKEKLLNGGNWSFTVSYSYIQTLTKDLMLLPLIAGYEVGTGRIDEVLTTLGVFASWNALINGLNLIAIGMAKGMQKIDEKLADLSGERRKSVYRNLFTSDFNEPIIKHSLPDYLLPPVPIDRVIRGSIYLKKHSKEFISSEAK